MDDSDFVTFINVEGITFTAKREFVVSGYFYGIIGGQIPEIPRQNSEDNPQEL